MRRIALFALCFLASGCAPAYQPAVDLTGVNPDIYHDDLAACRTKTNPGYSGQGFADGPMLVDTLIVASLGVAAAVVIAPAAAMYGGAGLNAGLSESYGAISGTVAGSAVGAATGDSPGTAPSSTPPPADPKAAIDRCLTGYGYKVQAPQS